MEDEKFYELVEELHHDEMALMRAKGDEYTQRSGDKFRNFKERAEWLGLSPFSVCLCDLSKHIGSLQSMAKGIELSSGESLRSRVIDLRNYLALLLGIAEEEKPKAVPSLTWPAVPVVKYRVPPPAGLQEK